MFRHREDGDRSLSGELHPESSRLEVLIIESVCGFRFERSLMGCGRLQKAKVGSLVRRMALALHRLGQPN